MVLVLRLREVDLFSLRGVFSLLDLDGDLLDLSLEGDREKDLFLITRLEVCFSLDLDLLLLLVASYLGELTLRCRDCKAGLTSWSKAAKAGLTSSSTVSVSRRMSRKNADTCWSWEV